MFGGPGGPLLPDSPFEPRFAISMTFLDFVRLPPGVAPPPPPGTTQAVFLLGPLTTTNPPPPPPGPHGAPGPPGAPNGPPTTAASIVAASAPPGGNQSSIGPVVSALKQDPFANVNIASQERNDEQGRLSFEGAGIYVQKLGSGDPAQTARLPEEVSEDYSRFIEFLKTLPNGDYVVYFKRGGQSHEQAAARQRVVKVRVVNHRLNPDSGDFKPAGEVAEPPKNPDAANDSSTTTKAPTDNERAENPVPAESDTLGDISANPPADWATLAAGVWLVSRASREFHSKPDDRTAHVDQLMEQFPSKRKRPDWRRKLKSQKS